MSVKTVYYYKVDVTKDDALIPFDGDILKEMVKYVVKNHAKEVDSFHSIDVTGEDEEMHTIIDIFKHDDDSMFCRFSKQKPSSTLLEREYATYAKKDILPDSDPQEIGIEKYTYAMLHYNTGIFSYVSSQGAPSENTLYKLFKQYANAYCIKLTPIPNSEALDILYNGDSPEISQLEVEIPIPDASVLSETLRWDAKEIMENEVNGNNLLKATLTIKSNIPRKSISRNKASVVRILNNLVFSKNNGDYIKAKVRGKTKTTKMRDFDLYEEYFRYTINIETSTKRGGKTYQFTIDELEGQYREELRNAYDENYDFLIMLVNRA